MRKLHRSVGLFLVFFTVWILTSCCADADMVWLKDSETPISGRLVESNAELIRFRCRIRDEEEIVEWKREQVEELVVTIDSALLEKLRPSEPQKYLDYAEQLSGFEADTYAIDTAKRLCLLAARWGQAELRTSSFRLLLSLCSQDERRSVRLLASIYDPSLKSASVPEVTLDTEAKKAAVELIQLIWQDKQSEAEALLQIPEVRSRIRKAVARYSGICRMDELSQAVKADSLTRQQLGQLLSLQQAIENDRDAVTRRDVSEGDWSETAERRMRVDELVPSFGNVLPYDPDKAFFRGGKWVAK